MDSETRRYFVDDVSSAINRVLDGLDLTGVSFRWNSSKVEDIIGNEDEAGSQSTVTDLADVIQDQIREYYPEASGQTFQFANSTVILD